MNLMILIFSAIASAVARPQGYNLAPPSGPSLLPRKCSNGQVLHVDGRCVTPRVNRRVFLYDVPKTPTPVGPPPFIPAPTVETNLLFIRTPEGAQGPDPIVVPPPQQEHVVYILNKQSEEAQKVIEVPASPPSDPEVYFVNYAEGENPTLPSGVDLQTALDAASAGSGQSVGGSEDFFTGGVGSAIGSSNIFKSNIGLGSTSGFGSISRFESDSSFGGSNGFGSSNGFGGNNGFGGSNSLGSSNGFGIGNVFGNSFGLGGSNGFETSNGSEDGSGNNFPSSNNGRFGIGGAGNSISGNGPVVMPTRLYRTP
ncbi:ATP-dependent RNA helicase A-like [Penaeus indicus]|uniref:ATP-dependent RNA helicase A-like n=1 Tax=Penaeus indicus TaxID=29960 RepID=UPI00300CB2C8